MSSSTFPEDCEREIRALHEFFEGWFRGEDDRDLARARDALGPEFELIGPDGSRRDREAVLAGIEGARGGYPAEFRIRVRAVECRDATADRCLCTYEERQEGPSTDTARVSTALFEVHDPAPEGVRWRHLQETWLPGGAPDGEGER